VHMPGGYVSQHREAEFRSIVLMDKFRCVIISVSIPIYAHSSYPIDTLPPAKSESPLVCLPNLSTPPPHLLALEISKKIPNLAGAKWP